MEDGRGKPACFPRGKKEEFQVSTSILGCNSSLGDFP